MTDRGTRPAPSVSPNAAASYKEQSLSSSPAGAPLERPGAGNAEAGYQSPLSIEAFDTFEAAEADIEAGFKRRLAGLRHLRPSERIAARQAARNWKIVARQELKARRAAANEARKLQRLWRAAAARAWTMERCRWP